MMIKDCEVEVTSEDDGFVGAWYRAILVDNPTKSGRKKLRIRYLTLLDEDGFSPLTEFVNQASVRPVPPENQYKEFILEEGLVVDADHKDGWWTGVVIKKMVDDNYLVYFDSPPDIIQFRIIQLRPHIHWTGSKWVGPEIKELDKSMFSPGTMVEVSSVTDKMEVAWFPAMMIKKIEVDNEKKFIVKDCNKHLSSNGYEARPNTTVDACRVRPTPLFSCEDYKLMDCVEAFHGGMGWRQGSLRKILSHKLYMVSLEGTKEEYVYKHSDLRPFKVWEDGAWHDQPRQSPVKDSTSNVIKKMPMRSSISAKPATPKRVTKEMCISLNPEENGQTLTKAETVAATGELRKKRVDAVMNYNKTHQIITSKVTPIGKESISTVTPSLVITATPLRQIDAETRGNKSLESMKTEDTGRKRKREEKFNSCLKETDASDVEKKLMILPFEKKSPFWKTLEKKEEYKSVTQSPHFSPLLEAEEDIREWSAVGMMVTFYGLLEEVKDLQLDVSSSKISSLRSSFGELEKHGFDVSMAQSRINKVLYLQDERGKNGEERKRIEKKIEAKKSEKHKFEEEMRELERKIVELKKEEAVGKEKKEEMEKRIMEMEGSAETIEKDIEEVELQFHTTVSAPW